MEKKTGQKGFGCLVASVQFAQMTQPEKEHCIFVPEIELDQSLRADRIRWHTPPRNDPQNLFVVKS
jgi:hypothetical protein